MPSDVAIERLKFYDKEDRPWPGPRLTSAAIVGHTTPNSARIWVRAWEPGSYCLVVSEARIDANTDPRRIDATTVELVHRRTGEVTRIVGQALVRDLDYDSDLTGVFEVEGLAAGREHHYALFCVANATGDRTDLWEVGRDFPHGFRTPPEAPERVSFGLYSCHMPFKGRSVRNMHMWESFHEALSLARADFVIGGGDQAYSDGDERVSIWEFLKHRKEALDQLGRDDRVDVMLSWYRDIYRGYWGDRAIRRVLRDFPNYMIWDDHEIMDGWGSYTEDELSNHLDTLWEWENKGRNLRLANSMFEAAKRVYLEYEHSHNPRTRKDQWDFSFEWPLGLRFFVLDMRGQRDFEREQNRILGDAQLERFEAWLAAQQRDEDAEVLFVVSPVPMIHLSDFIANTADLPLLGLADDLRDEWEHESNWDERDHLLDLLFDYSQARGKRVVFLSGDVHVAAAFRLTRESAPKARVYQLTSSGITYAKAPGRLLQLAVRKSGEITHEKDENGEPLGPTTTFSRLHVFPDNNFGLIHATKKGPGGLDLSWDLYGSTGEEDEIVKLRRVDLPEG